MVSIAYFILCHKEPERVARLVKRLQTDIDFFQVHFDTTVGKQQFKEWKKIIEHQCDKRNLEVVSEFRCRWGSFGGVNATLNAMRRFKDHNYDYFVNLSGDCYPIKPIQIIKNSFDGQTAAFMEVFELPTSIWNNGGMERLWYKHYFPSVGKHSKRLRIPRLNRKLPYKLKPYGGSAFFCLPKMHVDYILEFIDKKPAVKKFFKHTNIIDEVFFQTILKNSPFQSHIFNDNKRYISWNGSRDSHPKFLTVADFESFMKSDKLFARKFSLAVDKDILDLIDQKLENWKV
jgi:hypothetical protein